VSRGEDVNVPADVPVIEAFIGLGSNLAAPDRQLASALEALSMLSGTRLRQVSSLYRTAPVGYVGQPDFINAVARIETTLTPRALLDALLEIERRHGRVREIPNGPRTLDLDLLIYGDRRHHEEGLTVPHPRMLERAFVMVPLAEIAPERDLEGLGTARELAESLAREQRVERVPR
jgi:2-amino-4-hydroxy-6-hydroxymethyldihydropteridine diphosphokinase